MDLKLGHFNTLHNLPLARFVSSWTMSILISVSFSKFKGKNFRTKKHYQCQQLLRQAIFAISDEMFFLVLYCIYLFIYLFILISIIYSFTLIRKRFFLGQIYRNRLFRHPPLFSLQRLMGCFYVAVVVSE